MSRIDEAKALVRGIELTDELKAFGVEDEGSYVDESARFPYWNGRGTAFAPEMTADVLADSLHYFVGLGTRSVSDEAAIEPGASKYRGLPHLPAGFEWPDGQYFAAQLDLQEVSRLDLEGVLPRSGLLSLFFNGSAHCTVAHHAGPKDELEVRPYPDAASFPHAKYYMKDFQRPARIVLEPGYIFYVGSDAYDYRDIRKLIPEELEARLSELLGCSLAGRDPSHRLFGRPHYWQGEDEMWDDDEDPGAGESILLYQDEFGEGNIHFWVEVEAARRGDFSEAWLGYSGT